LPSRKFISLKVGVKLKYDVKDVSYLLKKSLPSEKLFEDSAYDAEWIHEICFDKQIQIIINPRKNIVQGFYRKKQMKNYSEDVYCQGSLIESGFGLLKRKYCSSVFGRKLKIQFRTNFRLLTTYVYCLHKSQSLSKIYKSNIL